MHAQQSHPGVTMQQMHADTCICAQVGTKVAETLESQTHQMEKIQGDLDEIKFTLKKAEKVIRDITRSMATDKCD